MNAFTLRRLRNTDFSKLYEKLLTGGHLEDYEKEAVLNIAIILLSAGDEHTKDLGYRIIVLYCNLFADYKPLYDIALAKGYVPIFKSIEYGYEIDINNEGLFYSEFLSSLGETYKSGNIYLTSQQQRLNDFFFENADSGVAVVAPTSYGKSELFVNFCNQHKNSTICMVVPTKALLAQMKKRVLQNSTNMQVRKIVTHPEMHNVGDTNFIAILTQERLLRIIQDDKDLKFDYIFIDEAHNLIYGDERSLLLAKVIAIINNRYAKTAFNYLTPFIVDANNLNSKYAVTNFKNYKISEHLKTERYYIADFRDGYDRYIRLYDQYIDEFIHISDIEETSEVDFAIKKSKNKNIIYLNSPPKLERFAYKLSHKLNPINDDRIEEACKDISGFFHKEYGLLDCLRKGVIYHHGSVPDIVKLYIENLYSNNENIRYVVTSSTLLEGVNIPAECLFLIECKKGRSNLTPSQFKNLVGRICRFSEVFDTEKGSLFMLEPSVYIVGSEYMSKKANIDRFIRDRVKVDKKLSDSLENVLLENTVIDDKNIENLEMAEEVLDNLEPGITGKSREYSKTEVGRLSYLNNIVEFNIIDNEYEIQKQIDELFQERKINTVDNLLDVISNIFIKYIPEGGHKDLSRIKEESTKRFYKMFIDWRMRNVSYNEMIGAFLRYWDSVDDPLVYVDKWGDTKREDSINEYWVDITGKSRKERVNLAIVRIKEEQDFLDNRIMKFVELLNDLELLDDDFYMTIKYGTTDKNKITMLKNGFGAGLATLLLENYSEFLTIDSNNNVVLLHPDVLENMRDNNENRIHIFEAQLNTRN